MSVRAGVRLVGAIVVLLADGACDEKLGPFAPRVRREDHRGRVVAGTRAQPGPGASPVTVHVVLVGLLSDHVSSI